MTNPGNHGLILDPLLNALGPDPVGLPLELAGARQGLGDEVIERRGCPVVGVQTVVAIIASGKATDRPDRSVALDGGLAVAVDRLNRSEVDPPSASSNAPILQMSATTSRWVSTFEA